MVRKNIRQTDIKHQITRREFLKVGGALMASAAMFSTIGSCKTSTSSPTSTLTTSTSGLTPKTGGTLRIMQGSTGASVGWPADTTHASGGNRVSGNFIAAGCQGKHDTLVSRRL